MARGGKRTGTPGKNYANRTDMHQPIRVAHWAEYGIVEVDGDRTRVDLRRLPFDVDALLAIFASSGMPHAQWWIDSWNAD